MVTQHILTIWPGCDMLIRSNKAETAIYHTLTHDCHFRGNRHVGSGQNAEMCCTVTIAFNFTTCCFRGRKDLTTLQSLTLPPTPTTSPGYPGYAVSLPWSCCVL